MILENNLIAIFFNQYCDCDLICNYVFQALYVLYYSTKTSNKSMYSMTNTILDRFNINVLFCRPGLYDMMKLGDELI